ncbi:probable indole-3-pyruvate monooxygenase YUCCA11 [Rhododendron vialii]|uniref:probable indole-3-pyruvate monooxygenase YUCCA11 n=1 Tax=Rhododendron vialii TaxID=182163 RepID=UPI00265F109C|nr:probable indole-3-pyruvate monooxygenase YUCCA11 [Rhododendron vialii]XP_058223697.1 probable indole-3-pyruvate monooxygenase YUCCA11 [Rhododendron vialii]
MIQETEVIIIGAGPAGIATSACLNLLSLPNIVLERESCTASLWKNKSYDRLKLHLAKQHCQLPHMPFPSRFPTFVSKSLFINYLDTYVFRFGVSPLLGRSVESASREDGENCWRVVARNAGSGETEVFEGRFLVVATGENSEGFVPEVVGLEDFGGEVVHSSEYGNGKRYEGKDVLVVGCGNSGMEIAYDLVNCGARAAISVRSPVHVLSKEMVQLGMCMLKLLPCNVVDKMVESLAKLKYGDFSHYGLQTPSKGPFYLKMTTGRSPVIDVGTMRKIRTGQIQVLPSITSIKGDFIDFANGKTNRFQAIVFATGYKSTVRKWLKDDGELFNEDGMPKKRRPDHWKGENGLYCVGFARAGLLGISSDAQNIANDICLILSQQKNR